MRIHTQKLRNQWFKNLIAGMFIMLSISCSKYESTNLEDIKIDAVKVGVLHNEYLKKIMIKLENDKSKSENKKEELTKIILSLNIDGVSLEEKTAILDVISNLTIDELKNQTISNLKNPIAIDYYNQIENAIDSTNNTFELNILLNNIIKNADISLIGSDWNTIMSYAETSKASAEYWYPTDKGGTGIGYDILIKKRKYLNKSEGDVLRELPGWVKADGRGAGYGMTGWALTGGLGGPLGFLGATLVSAIFSSADYAAYN